MRAHANFAPSLVLLFRPVVRFCLRHSLQIQDAIEAMKSAFLAVAQEELQRNGRVDQPNVPSVSRISAMTGMHRRDVSRLMRGNPPVRPSENLITRVIGQWRSNARFTAPSGGPRVLRVDSKQSEFAELVSSISKDLNPYTVLLELERLGYVQETKRGVKLIARSYIPAGDMERGVGLLSADAADLMWAVEENLLDRPQYPNLHLKTEFDNIAPEHIPKIRQWLLDEGSAFHERAFTFLSQFDRDANPQAVTSSKGASGKADNGSEDGAAACGERVRVAVGSFSCTVHERDGKESGV